MNKILFLFTLLISFHPLIAQDSLRVFKEITIEKESITIQLGQWIIDGYEIMNINGLLYYEKEFTAKNLASLIKPANLIVRVTDLNKNFIKDIIVDYHDLDVGLTQFAASYSGERNFLILNTKYKFYIVDLDNYKAIGPFAPEFKGEGVDAISGMLRNIRLFDNDRYLFGTSVDNGVFCFNLSDLNNPAEVKAYYSEPKFLSTSYIFLDNYADSLFNCIYVSTSEGKIEEIKYINKSF